ncbi:folate family ECF transporter S component [uncultured Anaerococcus sp.]|uniref:folate family ECF transporter S component n=1 Tax=uncultured Anaerococcus sp. TaxID=293428 RepID=UPI002609CB78|nr:folate family ECF transporter S component [uncultured Anaerococcus sp.]
MNKKISTKDLTTIALLTALSVVFKFFSINIGETRRYSFILLAVMISGIFYGPLVGAITGGLGDVIGHLVLPQGMFHPGFTLTAIIIGISSGIISRILSNTDIKNKNLAISLACCIFNFLIVALFLNTLWLSQLTGTSYWPLLVSRIIKSLIEMSMNWILLYLLFPQLKKIILK